MKKSTTPVFTFLLLIMVLFTDCMTADEKKDAALQRVEKAKNDLYSAQNDAHAALQKAMEADEWKFFKPQAEKQIVKNKNRITALRMSTQSSGKQSDQTNEKKIDLLEKQNNDLKKRLTSYPGNDESWRNFKRDFNEDMDDIVLSLNNLNLPNVVMK